MTQQTIDKVGVLQKDQQDKINENFTELYLGAPWLASGAVRHDAISLTATELGGTETNTSFTFPTNGAILLAAWLDVTDAEAASTVDVGTQGTSNDPDGILDGVSVATTGYVEDIGVT